MRRLAMDHLQKWLNDPGRKPLVMRGARQVGKTWLIRTLAGSANKKLIELNFEKNPEYKKYFSSNDPKQVLLYLEAMLGFTVQPEQTLLFLDEVQTAPELISKLRWFYEDMPALAVVATGSLLEFTLSNYPYSMPVGRIGYFHLEPMSFEEFLLALGRDSLLEFITNFKIADRHLLIEPIHDLLMSLFKEYVIIGGLPAAVASWVEKRSLTLIDEIHQNLLSTYRDDFTKYTGRLSRERLEEVFMAIPKMIGNKFIYNHVNKEIATPAVKQALELLIRAKLCNKVIHSAGNGIPLAAETKDTFFKVIFLDTGLVSSNLGLKMHQWLDCREIILVNQGSIAEQVVGQQLRGLEPYYVESQLYYWAREEKTSSAEVDYLIQHQATIVPIEVKAGSTGQLKSLHLFMALKKLSLAVRICSAMPDSVEINVNTSTKIPAKYKMLSLPFYLVGQIPRLLDHQMNIDG